MLDGKSTTKTTTYIAPSSPQFQVSNIGKQDPGLILDAVFPRAAQES
jgi:hypothetical protein